MRTALARAALVACLAASARVEAQRVLDAGERVPAAWVLLAPEPLAARTEASLLEASALALQRTTALAVIPGEVAGVAAERLPACEPRLRFTCWSAALEASPAGYLIVLSILGDHGPARIAGFVLPRAAALEAIHELAREAALFELALALPPTELGDDPRGAIAALLAHAVPFVRARGDGPLAELTVDAPEGLEVTLDGVRLGTTSAGGATVSGVRPGLRTVALFEAERPLFAAEVELSPGSAVRVAAGLPALAATGAPHPLREGARWGGALLGAAGAALLVLAVTSASPDLRAGCVTRAGEPEAVCPRLGAPSFGFDAAAAPTADPAALNPSGVTPLALGLGLLAGGAPVGLGALFAGEDEDVPWLGLAAGLLAGAGAFGLASLAGAR